MLGLPNLSNQKFGQYELRRLLGAGGMGAVYLAWQANLKREVAIKILPPTFAANPGMVERFTREAETAARLEHPHIVPIYDYGVEQGISYVVMRLLPGGSLSERLTHRAQNDDPLPNLRETANMLNDLASALDFAHSKGVVHRDIKPNNVMFDAHGTAFIVDFGIARLINATSALTGSNTQIGTPAYMSPEQWMGEEATAKSDQYALGVMTYVLLTGDLPFDGQTPFALMHKHLSEAPMPLHLRRMGLPETLTPIVERALAKLPTDRYEKASDFAAAFDKAIVDLTPGQATSFFVTPLPISINEIVFTPLPTMSAAPAYEPPKRQPGELGGVLPPLAPPTMPDKPTTIMRPVAAWLGYEAKRRPALALVAVVLVLAVGGLYLVLKGDDGGDNVADNDTQTNATQTALAVAGGEQSSPTPSPSPSITPTIDYDAIAGITLTYEAGVNAAATNQLAAAQTQTATVWTATPTPTSTPTNGGPPSIGNPGGPNGQPTLFTGGNFPPALNGTPSVPTIAVANDGGGILARRELVVFASNRDGDYELYTINPDERLRRNPVIQLTDNTSNDTAPSIAPDGRRIAVVSDMDGNDEIYMLDVATREARRLTIDPAADTDPVWSPNGERIAFASNRDGDFEIYIVNLADRDLTQITENTDIDDRYPTWSPDGTQLVFTREEGGASQLFAIELISGTVHEISDGGTYNGAADWSADGTRIVFSSNRDHPDDIDLYIIELGPNTITPLVARPGRDDHPAWSPDDRFVVFQSDAGSPSGAFDVWVVGADGEQLHGLVEHEDDDIDADW